MPTIVISITGPGRAGSVELRDSPAFGRRWVETSTGGKFIGRDHQGPFQMGSYANAGRMFLEEPSREEDEEIRRLYPTSGVLYMNNFTYPGTAVGQRGSGSLQDSDAVNALREGFVWWQVTAVR